jgi:hypothetical protein
MGPEVFPGEFFSIAYRSRVTNELAFNKTPCSTLECMAEMLAARVLGNSRPLQPPHVSVDRDI